MNRLKLITYIAIGLLISNLVLVAFIFRNGERPHRGGPRDIIIERLHFDKDQVKAYDLLITEHRSNIREQDRLMLDSKNKLYGLLINDTTEKSRDSLEKAIAETQIRIEHINYDHFRDIENLCNAEQKKYFNELVRDIAGLFTHPDKRPKR